jgi:phosphoribosylglycinamide formyltransferase-1
MRLLSAWFCQQFPNRILNIHPALLPAFPGLEAQKQALDYGARITGCTVHFVDEGCDSGPIIMQAAVPILDGDDETALTARILAEEHRLYPAALRAIADGRVQVSGRRVTIRP